ncbi:protein-tyrosine kinase [Oxalobacteraceae bacterium GrIS 2.11]
MNTIAKPLTFPSSGKNESSIGAMLLESGKITPENAESIIRLQKELNIRFGEAAIRLGFITETDIQQILAQQFDYPYLQKGEEKYSSQLVAAYEPFNPQVETLRAIRSQLMLRWISRGRKALVVISVEPGDGASLFVANLGVVFSQLGEHTLLVDANLRTPCQHQIFDIQERRGLSDLLAGRAELDVIAKINSFVDLSVLTSGTLPPNPQELLGRSTFKTFNAQFEARFDVVMYDATAFKVGADALAIAAIVGGVIIVAQKNKTAIKDIDALVQKIKSIGAETVGTVLLEN